MSGCLEGKVVLVTGAGRGIGREIALLAAKEGAAVVVNDLGVAADGAPTDETPAEEVVREIKAAGGKAVVNSSSITEAAAAEGMVQQALDTFGGLDAVVNNAGFLRDRIFHKMSRVDWQAVIDVHLTGYYNVSRAAANIFKEQQHGNFVHFSSASGLVGNFGQASYAAAKMGVVGLSKSIALDMQRVGVRSNCVVPFAWSRLVGTIPESTPEEKARLARARTLTPDKVAPLVVFLASDLSAGVTGQIFGARKNEVILISQPRPLRTMHRDGGWTPQALADQMLPAFRPAFYPLDRSADVFNWDPM